MKENEHIWMRLRACKDEDARMFYSEYKTDQKKAIELCSQCPVQAECLQHALARNEHGIWGGTTERERSRIKRNNRNR